MFYLSIITIIWYYYKHYMIQFLGLPDFTFETVIDFLFQLELSELAVVVFTDHISDIKDNYFDVTI